MDNRRAKDFVNSFGNHFHPSKKPKLEVTLSQAPVSGFPVLKRTEHVELRRDFSHLTKNKDDLWGDDFDENEVNQCMLIESQALSQSITIEKPLPNSATPRVNQVQNVSTPGTTKEALNQLVGKTPGIRSGTPIFRAASAGNLPDTPVRTSGYVSFNSSGKFNAEGAAIHLQSQVNKFKEEFKNLRDQLQCKEGEVKNLRTALSRSKSEQIKKKHDLMGQLNKVKEESSKRISELDKQIKDLTTELEFKIMESKTLEEKLKKLRDPSCVVDSPRPSTSRKSLDFNRTVYDEKLSKDVQQEMMDLNLGNLSFHANDGFLLAKLLEPEFYPPLSSIDDSSKVSLSDDDKNKGVSDVLRDCLQPLMMLHKYESFSTYSARKYIKKIIHECFKTIYGHLQSMKEEGPHKQLVNRSKQLLQSSHTILPLSERCCHVTSDGLLLKSMKLYRDEKGIEVRRIIGLVDVLVKVSSETGNLLLTSSFPLHNNCDTCDNDNNNNSDIRERLQDESNLNHDCKKNEGAKLHPMACRKSLFHGLRDLVLLISTERRTLQYNGVLAGAAILLTSVIERRLDLTEEWQKLFLEIIQHVLTSCPGPTVILHICRFLRISNHYPHIVKNLCTYSVDKGEVEYDRCYTFKKDTCPITVLCYGIQSLEPTKRYLITDVVTQWFFGLLCIEDKTILPHWLTFYQRNDSEIQRDCACPWNISKLITTLLSEAALCYDNERRKLDDGTRSLLEKLLERGLLLFSRMLQHNNFGLNLSHIEGQYELFIHTISMLEPDLPLQPFQKKIMEDVAIQEAQKDPARKKNLEDNKDLKNTIFFI